MPLKSNNIANIGKTFLHKNCLSLSYATCRAIHSHYQTAEGLSPVLLHADGRTLAGEADPLAAVAAVTRLRRHAIEESVRWGEPYIFLLADGIVSWVVALVDGERVTGGVCGGEVASAEDPPDVTAAVRNLEEWGHGQEALCHYFAALPVWPQTRLRPAAESLFKNVYAVTGWKPLLLQRNHANASQQRQIAEAIHQRKRTVSSPWPIEDERQLLLLIRAGDHPGARKHLNQLLAAMFLDSPQLPVLKARVLELLGYLVRVAVEDAPDSVPLMHAHQNWMVRIIHAPTFESLCSTVRDSLDDFLFQVAQQGLSRTHLHVRRALDYVRQTVPQPVTLDGAAAAAGVSRFRIAHLLKAGTSQTFLQHVMRHRIAYACQLLETTDLSCAAIAAESGFADQSHLSRSFRAATGTTPARYRRNYSG